VGGTGVIFGGAFHRVPYALIGIPGIGKGAGLEFYTSVDPSAPFAEISTKVVNGIPQGINTVGHTTLEKVTSIEATVNGIQTTVGNKADKSQITQLSSQIS